MIEAVQAWPVRKKATGVAVIVASVALVILAFSWSQKEEYHVLYSNLSEADAGQIVQKLKEMKVPYRAEAGGILVPADRVYEARLHLASQGLPQGGGVGFELFDKTSFGTTEFVQKLNYKRALQGELARTVMAIGAVEQCRVHLAIPEKSLFAREGESERPTASVLVKLRQGKTLSSGQVDGIVHLVASSVEGLNSQEITVVDAKGNVLSKPSGDVAGLSASQFDFQSSYSKDLEARIISILEPVVGKGKVRAKVSAVIDFSRNETTEEKFDPDGQVVRSEQKQNEKSTTMGAGGVPGVASNLPGKRTVAATPSQGQSEKQSQTVNYEMTKVTSHTVNAPGLVKKLTAAVLVDGTYTPQQGSKDMKYTPRSEEDVRRYEELVRETMGFTESRGDQIKVVNMPFEVVREEEVPPPKTRILEMAAPAARYVLPLLAVILLVVFVLRPLAQSLSAPGPNLPGSLLSIPQNSTDVDKAGARKELPPRAQVADWARKNPTDAANVIKSWMR
ncbi:MAG: flagellar M-ring protein FliF [Deltaproteobacteria bacterium CG2_30_66_27]|nr:MAG: flagellar M-ring protein FliF [Deltaproteobacteria bacterium CG2_30_66_27]